MPNRLVCAVDLILLEGYKLTHDELDVLNNPTGVVEIEGYSMSGFKLKHIYRFQDSDNDHKYSLFINQQRAAITNLLSVLWQAGEGFRFILNHVFKPNADNPQHSQLDATFCVQAANTKVGCGQDKLSLLMRELGCLLADSFPKLEWMLIEDSAELVERFVPFTPKTLVTFTRRDVLVQDMMY